MEPEDMKYCCTKGKRDNKNCSCIAIIAGILITLLVGAIVLILGVFYASTLIENLAVLILGAVIIGILTILSLIYRICICKKNKYC